MRPSQSSMLIFLVDQESSYIVEFVPRAKSSVEVSCSSIPDSAFPVTAERKNVSGIQHGLSI